MIFDLGEYKQVLGTFERYLADGTVQMWKKYFVTRTWIDLRQDGSTTITQTEIEDNDPQKQS